MPPDFGRNVHGVLGLPFDAISQEQAHATLKRVVHQGSRCFFSTPNLNFTVACLTDSGFRDSVLQSDLSLADGWPVILVARLLRIPLPERIAGSSLFERLCRDEGSPLSVYFFGGPEGAAERACARINRGAGGLRCVGYEAPGFGSLDEMSRDDYVQRVDAAAPDFVIVALGAMKGQAWIQRNRRHLHVPLISHLGAVINFAAGTVARAPRWVQQAGLEWLWRIKEEPFLWRRYRSDGLVLLRLIVTRVLPLIVHERRARWLVSRAKASSVQLTRSLEHNVLHVVGALDQSNLDALRELLRVHAAERRSVVWDLSSAVHLDSGAIGLLMLLHGWHAEAGLGWRVDNAPDWVERLLGLNCAGYLLNPLTFHSALS